MALHAEAFDAHQGLRTRKGILHHESGGLSDPVLRFFGHHLQGVAGAGLEQHLAGALRPALQGAPVGRPSVSWIAGGDAIEAAFARCEFTAGYLEPGDDGIRLRASIRARTG